MGCLLGCSKNYGSFLVIDKFTAPTILGCQNGTLIGELPKGLKVNWDVQDFGFRTWGQGQDF